MWYAFDYLGADGEPKDRVIIPDLKEGQYIIQVVPKPSASPSDTYGLRLLARGEEIVLAQDVPVSDIPLEGYSIIVTENEVLVNSSPTADAGPDQVVVANSSSGAEVSLNGTGSSDPDDDALAFSWSAPGITFDDLNSPTTSAIIPLGTTTITLVVNDGTVDSAPDTVDITVSSGATAGATTLLEDDFNRASNPIVGTPSVGGPWVELEETEALVRIKSNKLFFDDTSDKVNRPLVKSSFTQPSTGTLEWGFDFDWRRTGDEDTYRVLMQLGDGPAMNDGSQDAGVGVNLIWTTIGGVHQSLGYRDGDSTTFLEKVSGAIHIAVVADLDSHTYSVKVGGGAVHANIPFDADVPLNQVRFFTDALNEQHFSGQSFDNVVVTTAG
jgi:LysM repeat protein